MKQNVEDVWTEYIQWCRLHKKKLSVFHFLNWASAHHVDESTMRDIYQELKFELRHVDSILNERTLHE